MRGSRVEYRMMGYGDVPVADAVTLLDRAGFDGFFSLEWVKRWNPDLQEPGIVLPTIKLHGFASGIKTETPNSEYP